MLGFPVIQNCLNHCLSTRQGVRVSSISSGPVALFAGRLQPLPPEGQITGIFKQPVARALVSAEGLAGDAQGDRRVHGGPEKAVHYYPAEHYTRLAERLPGLAAALVPGVLGENVSATGLTEQDVCIGDVYALGECRLQVSQPRRPCWKISHRLEHPGLSRLVADLGLTGWYFRVLEGGEIRAGDGLERVECPAPGLTLARLWAASEAHRPALDELRALAAAPGLNEDWVRRLTERADWLAQHARA
jgi:MOSC domain-containing protein YiiM